jgi:hypothetical protein
MRIPGTHKNAPRSPALLGAIATLLIAGGMAVFTAMPEPQVPSAQAWNRVEASCASLGDSIAHGLGAVLPGCATRAVWGITAIKYASQFTGAVKADRVAVISLGTNDSATGSGLVEFEGSLRQARSRVSAPRVVWLRPGTARPEYQAVVARVAADNGDAVEDVFAEQRSGDGVHASADGYRAIARRLRLLTLP